MPMGIIKNDRGIALLVTLSIITILIAVTLEMNKKMRSAVFSTAATMDRITLLQMASSGIDIAEAILITDKKHSISDSIQEDWADPEKVGEIVKEFSFEKGTLTLSITDELGKIQINSLVKFPEGRQFNASQKIMWDRFLSLLVSRNEVLENVEPLTITDSVKDWLDSGDDDAITGLNGAESDYYKDLDPPYTCKNGPFTDIGEVALVKGITPELFQGAGGVTGLSTYITVFGMTKTKDDSFTYEGKININTADLPVLEAILPVGSQDFAQLIYDYRKDTSEAGYIHDLSSPNWYKSVPGLADVDIDPNLITISSDIFRVESVSTFNEMKMKISTMLKREKSKKTGKWICKVLRREIE